MCLESLVGVGDREGYPAVEQTWLETILTPSLSEVWRMLLDFHIWFLLWEFAFLCLGWLVSEAKGP